MDTDASTRETLMRALNALRLVRTAGRQASADTTTLVHLAKADGMAPRDIAHLLGLSESQVYAVLRRPAGQIDGAVIDAYAGADMLAIVRRAHEINSTAGGRLASAAADAANTMYGFTEALARSASK